MDNFNLRKYLTEGKLLQENYNKESLLKALGDADDAMIQLSDGRNFIIYNPNSNNQDNADMWHDDVVFGVNKDGDEQEIEYSDISGINLEEVYSEKQRKWACAQDGPTFDEMCKDTAISKKKKLKEFTNYGQEGQYPAKENPGDIFQQKEVEDMFPNGMASRGDRAFQDKLKKHADWTEQSGYNNTFVHVQYHETEGLEDEYFIYQTQHYNHNYDDFRSPKFTELSITKNRDTDREEKLGTYIVSTPEYIKDIKDLDNKGVLGKRVMEQLNEGWIDSNLEKRNQALYDELVPGMGNSDTLEGEMLRAINRIIYRYYNDGDFFYRGYGTETAGPAHSFLINSREIPLAIQSTLQSTFNKIMQSSGDPEKAYENLIEFALKQIVDFVEAKNGNYTPSDEDMFKYPSEYEDEEDYEDDYDDYYDDEDDDY